MAGGSPLSSCDIFEVLVILFQVCGIMGLCLSRLMPRSTAWSSRGQVGSIVALFGLALRARCAGATTRSLPCSPVDDDSVLIGMTMGSGSIELAEPAVPAVTSEPELAA